MFALILLICTVVTGFVWCIHYFYLRKRGGLEVGRLTNIAEQVGSFFPVFLFVFILRSFLFEPFRIPSSSLEPTLLVGDFILVNKYAYGLRFPVFEKKILSLGEPKRGDIAVFRWPPNDKYDFIKRVVGLPGDHIQYKDNILYINGKKAPQQFDAYTSVRNELGQLMHVERKTEQLAEVKHNIYLNPQEIPHDMDVYVPKGQYFMMGDNRDNSSDSRFWGFVSEENLRGKAILTWLSWDGNLHKFRWGRIGKIIH